MAGVEFLTCSALIGSFQIKTISLAKICNLSDFLVQPECPAAVHCHLSLASGASIGNHSCRAPGSLENMEPLLVYIYLLVFTLYCFYWHMSLSDIQCWWYCLFTCSLCVKVFGRWTVCAMSQIMGSFNDYLYTLLFCVFAFTYLLGSLAIKVRAGSPHLPLVLVFCSSHYGYLFIGP
jgi:hypothetical protein